MNKPSIFEVAEKAGVSKSTVSRVLNNSNGISEEAKVKVLKAVEELKYRPNISARGLRKNENTLIGILITSEQGDKSISHYINSKKISGIVKKVKELGYDVLVFIEDISDRIRLMDIIREKGLAGIILLDTVPVDVLETFRSYSIPFVLVNWYIPNYQHQVFVKTDLAEATKIALDEFVSKGYTEIGLINWQIHEMMEPIIENTFLDYMQEKGYGAEHEMLVTTYEADEKEIINYLESTQKRAYICFSYPGSFTIIEYCKRQGINVPADLALISYEFFDFYDYMNPKLTGIQQQADLMGEMAAEKLIQLIRKEGKGESELVKPILIRRESY